MKAVLSKQGFFSLWCNLFFPEWLVEDWKCSQNKGRYLSEAVKGSSSIYIQKSVKCTYGIYTFTYKQL